jgi:hypothetical protein
MSHNRIRTACTVFRPKGRPTSSSRLAEVTCQVYFPSPARSTFQPPFQLPYLRMMEPGVIKLAPLLIALSFGLILTEYPLCIQGISSSSVETRWCGPNLVLLAQNLPSRNRWGSKITSIASPRLTLYSSTYPPTTPPRCCLSLCSESVLPTPDTSRHLHRGRGR